MSKITYGKRIKYNKHENLLVSHKIFTDGVRMVRVIIDVDQMLFKFVDPATGMIIKQYQKKWTNLEVLQRNVKKRLIEFLGVAFDKEERNQPQV